MWLLGLAELMALMEGLAEIATAPAATSAGAFWKSLVSPWEVIYSFILS